MIPWSPLARGRLARGASPSDATSRGQTDRFGKTLYSAFEEADRAVLEQVDAVAKKRGVPNAQVALAWLLQKPGVTAPIVGATKLSHLEYALAAEQLELSADEIARLEEPYVPHATSGHS